MWANHHRSNSFVWPKDGDPPSSWDDRHNEEYLAPNHGRGTELMMTEDQPLPVRSEPVPMDFQAPLHTPYGTAERTYEGFWGAKNLALDRRSLLPDYAIAENEWDRNPRECGKQIAERSLLPYETADSFNSSTGATLVRNADVKDQSVTQYMRFTQKTAPTMYNADPIRVGGAGGGVPRLGPYIGRGGSSKPSWVPGYVGPAGGAMPSAPPVEAELQLPSATRANRQYEEIGNAAGGDSVAYYGDENVNPHRGGRPSLLATEYEDWGHRNGGFVAGGPEWEAGGGVDSTLWNPNDGARYRYMPPQDGANDPVSITGKVSAGPSLDLTPQVGGRSKMSLNYDKMLGGGLTSGMGSDLTNNPQDGGRLSRLIDWDIISSGGASSGVGSDLTHNPQEGGRLSQLINWDIISSGGASSGMGSDLTHNPQKGGRASQLMNWDVVCPGGISSGVGSDESQNPNEGGRPSGYINWSIMLPGGISSGVGSSLENNPSKGGRAPMKRNWQMINPGGLSSGVSGSGCNDIVGGNHWTHTEGCAGYLPPGGSLNQDYGGGDVAFGLEVSPRHPRTSTLSMMIPGMSGGRGTPKIPEMFITLPNTRMNGDGVYDDSPDPVLQIAARSTVASHTLLDFSRKNLDDLAITVPCV
jgi:hypothetical protein